MNSKVMLRRWLFLPLLILCAAYVYSQSVPYVNPISDPLQIAETATKFSISQGIDVEDFEISSLSYDYIARDWVVLYKGRQSTMNSGHFMINIKDNDTNEIALVPGL